MNKKVKALWLKALRSGKYKQTTGCLRDKNENGEIGYCCLGVLTDIYIKTHEGAEWGDSLDKMYTFDGEAAILTEKVQEWAGLELPAPLVNGDSLAFLNDSRNLSFKQIAERIEEYL